MTAPAPAPGWLEGEPLGPVDAVVLAGLCLCAAALHFALAPGHAGGSVVLGVGFGLVAWGQAGMAVALLVRPLRRLVAAATMLQGAVLTAWAVSRAVGLPFGAHAGEPEAIGAADAWTSALEAAFILLAVRALGRSSVRDPARSAPAYWGTAGALLLSGALTIAVVTSPSARHHHDPPAETAGVAVTRDGHVHALAATGRPATAEQARRAADLLARTRAAVHPRYDRTDAARAAGFVPLQGDEADLVHWVNMAWMENETVLDPEEPESLVYRTTPEGPRLEAAMYILPEVGMPVPDVGGSLTTWHNHVDLCFRTTDGHIVGTTKAGPCPAGSLNVPTPDMLHVWTVDHPGGPFAV